MKIRELQSKLSDINTLSNLLEEMEKKKINVQLNNIAYVVCNIFNEDDISAFKNIVESAKKRIIEEVNLPDLEA